GLVGLVAAGAVLAGTGAAQGGAAALVVGGALGVVGIGLAGPALVAPALRLAGHPSTGVALVALGVAMAAVAAGIGLASLADRFAEGLGFAVVAAVAAAGLVVGGRSGRGPAAALARRGLGREPRRVAATAGSLVVGVGVASTLLVMAASVRNGVSNAVSGTFRGDFVVVDGPAGSLGGGAGGLPPELARDLGAVPGVAVASGVRVAQVEVAGRAQAVPAVDAASLAPIFDVGLASGSVADLGGDGLAVNVERASEEGWELGDPVTVAFPTTGPERFHVVALYRNADLTGDLLLGVEALARRQADPADAQVFVGLDAGADRSRLRTELTDVVARYPSARLLDPGEYQAEQEARVDRALELALALVALAIAIAIAIVGVANTLALGTVERRRELALLRAVGASGRQVRALVRWEAVAVSLVGSVAGVVVGVGLAWATLGAVGQGGYRQLEVPLLQLAGVVLATGLAGVAAAALPARRAARVDVVDALAAE
ncbi:MAG: FtsX-like permease family protein, partial [Acidimicrobiia bacterium]|nr:FtsX-like permease family protein [Acidimicrobiia bacterium]